MRHALVALALLALAYPPPVAAADDVVEVRCVRQGGGAETRYRYTITNNSQRDIVIIMIGVDFREGVPHLDRLPKGWTRETSTFVDYGWTLDPATHTTQKGWLPLVMTFEERDQIAVSWMTEDPFGTALQPDKSATFEINVGEKEDPSYESAPWTVIFADGRNVTGTLAKPRRR